MKKNLFAALTLCMGLFLLYSCKPKAAYPVVVENPQAVYSNTSSITIEKVELTDSVTTLFMKATYRPHNWIRVDSAAYLVANGKNYPVTGSEKLVLGKEFWMPDSGVDYFTLSFAPLPAGTERFNFIEGEPEDYFKIFGVSLTGEVKNSLPKVTYNPEEELIPSVISAEKAVVKGQIFGYEPAMGKEMLKFYYTQFGSDGKVEDCLTVDEKGKFEMEITPYFPADLMMRFGTFFVVPGKTTEVYVDLATGDMEYKGALCTLNKEYKKIDELLEVNGLIEDVLAGINGMTESEAIDFMNKNFEQKLDSVRALNICKATQYLVNQRADYYYTEIRHNLPRYCQIWIDNFAKGAPYKAPAFTDALETENKLSFGDFAETPYFTYFRCESQNPLAVEKKKVGNFLSKVSGGYKPTEEDFEEYEQLSSPIYKELILAKQAEGEKLLAEFEKRKNVHYLTLEEVPDEQLVAKLVEPYKGQPVLVDIWATWCGPCRQAMETIKPMKEALKGKVTFLYVTGTTSPKAKWMKMILDISGEHYYLTDKQYTYLMGKFESQGVPTYLLFDSEGAFMQKHVGYPGNETVQKELEGLMGKRN